MFVHNKLINFTQHITFMPQEKDLNMPSLRSATLALIFSATIEQFCATAGNSRRCSFLMAPAAV